MEYNPVFEDMYRHLVDMCRNVEDVMQMFSKELKILDQNTVQLMIDEMQAALARQQEMISELHKQYGDRNSDT